MNHEKKRIIVCGYPKSGNTWLTRLTAEIVGCPVVGFWCVPFNQDEAIEGSNRNSEFQCFKAHHTLEQLQHTFQVYGNGTEKIIYIYRDPRDVVVSASHYFKLSPRFKRVYNFLSAMPCGLRFYYKVFGPLEDSTKYKINILTQGLIEGTKEGYWLDTSWEKHVKSFLKADILIIRYEDLKINSKREAIRICKYLGIKKSDDELDLAIHNQSFSVKKEKFLSQGNNARASFLREGNSGKWKNILEKRQVQIIHDDLDEFMRKLGYSTDL